VEQQQKMRKMRQQMEEMWRMEIQLEHEMKRGM